MLLLCYFLDLTDPVNVISLYPHLLPSELQATVTEPLPTAPPTLTGDDLKKGTEHLISYLTQVGVVKLVKHNIRGNPWRTPFSVVN